nr:PriCT-2 domain-containing protein [Prochloraceae cyanobacterium]
MTKYSASPQINETIARLLKLGLPPLPVAPKQDPRKDWCHVVAKTSDNLKFCPLDKNLEPIARFTGKNPSFLSRDGKKAFTVKHRQFQERLPTAAELKNWFSNPDVGIGTLGGHAGIVWLDIDRKNYPSQNSCEIDVKKILDRIGPTWVEQTGSGGYRIAVRPNLQPRFTNFATEQNGPHVGEALFKGRFTVLAPSIHPNGNPYKQLHSNLPVAVESLEAIGIHQYNQPPIKNSPVNSQKNTLIKQVTSTNNLSNSNRTIRQFTPSRSAPEKERDLARASLDYIDPDSPYDDWLRVGMALHSIGDDLLSVWDDWSSKGQKYQPGECEVKWRSFSGNAIKIGTLIYYAKLGGFEFPYFERTESNNKNGHSQELQNSPKLNMSETIQPGSNNSVSTEQSDENLISQTVQFKHFDTRTGNWIPKNPHKSFDLATNSWIYDDRPTLNNPDNILSEDLDHTLLQTFFPDGEFSIGHVDEYTSTEDLNNHPQGHQLLISSGTRFLYTDPQTHQKIDSLCPDLKDRGAYGSLFIGECDRALNKQLNVLIVDDLTGENGNILPIKTAHALVGDCYGQISPDLATQLSGTVERVIQHRIKFQEDRFAKGTFKPSNLNKLPYLDPNTPQIDLILPTTSFKGGDKKNNPITPGLYRAADLWIGQKDLSPIDDQTQKARKMAISEVHRLFGDGLRDYAKVIKEKTAFLKKVLSDLRFAAKYYCQVFDKRQQKHHESDNSQLQDNDDLLYKLLKTSLKNGNYRLLQHPWAVKKLKKFFRKQFLDLATGRAIEFDRAMIIPSKDLKNGEICVPWFKPGQEIVNFRSPLINSNGMCVSVNKHVQDMYAPNGKVLLGVILVSDEDHQRIVNRLNRQIRALAKEKDITLDNDNPLVWDNSFNDLSIPDFIDRVKQLNQTLDDFQKKGIDISERIPLETESQRQARDFDGDAIAVGLAVLFPNLTHQIKQRNLPENALDPTRKLAKESFPENATVGDVALHMMDNMSLGAINNHAHAIEALESEMDLLNSVGAFAQRIDFLHKAATRYQSLIEIKENFEKIQNSLPPERRTTPEPNIQRITEFIEPLQEIVKIAAIPSSQLTNNLIDRAFSLNKSIYKQLTQSASFENQVATDMKKSARSPDREAIDIDAAFLHRQPDYIRDRKKQDVYKDRPMKCNGFSPVELLVNHVNQCFEANQLEASPTATFKNFFPQNYTPLQYNQALQQKNKYDRTVNFLTTEQKANQNSSGPVLRLSLGDNKFLNIRNVARANHPLYKNKDQKFNLKLGLKKSLLDKYHQLVAYAETIINGKKTWKILGDVCENSR